jgi:hypothetical protein
MMPIPVTITLTQPVTGLEVYDMDGGDQPLAKGDYAAGDTIEVTIHSTVCCHEPHGRLNIRGNGADARLTPSEGEVLWP